MNRTVPADQFDGCKSLQTKYENFVLAARSESMLTGNSTRFWRQICLSIRPGGTGTRYLTIEKNFERLCNGPSKTASALSAALWNLCLLTSDYRPVTGDLLLVNKVNLVNMWKTAKFTTYPHERKGLGERGERLTEVFCWSRTSHAN